MAAAVASAQKSVYIESFILVDDDTTHYFFKALKEKAGGGVTVKIIVDQVGNFWTKSLDAQKFKDAGAEVLFFNRWFYRNHRKVLIVDESIAFVGGVNIRGKYARWLDLHVRLTGSVVRSLLKSFSRVYQLAEGTDPRIIGLEKLRLPKTRNALRKTKSWLIAHFPFRGTSALRDYYEKKCREAKETITIVTPYFVPHRWLTRALNTAIKRGVRVDVLMPYKTDLPVLTAANWIFADELSDGLHFYFLPEMNHAKVLLVDNREGLIGSNNIDARSFDVNLEASVVFQRKDMVGDLRKIVERWKISARPYNEAVKDWPWYYSILRFFIKLVQPIL